MPSSYSTLHISELSAFLEPTIPHIRNVMHCLRLRLHHNQCLWWVKTHNASLQFRRKGMQIPIVSRPLWRSAGDCRNILPPTELLMNCVLIDIDIASECMDFIRLQRAGIQLIKAMRTQKGYSPIIWSSCWAAGFVDRWPRLSEGQVNE